MQYILYNQKANNGHGKDNADVYIASVKEPYELVNVCETDIVDWTKKLTAEDL